MESIIWMGAGASVLTRLISTALPRSAAVDMRNPGARNRGAGVSGMK